MNPVDTNIFVGEDLRLIESLVYRPELKPAYDTMKNCLVWDDECAEDLTPRGYESLCDLWMARSYIHRGLDFSHTLDPEYFKDVWERATQQKINWPGFRRLVLSPEDRAYYEEMMRTEADEI